MRKLRITYQCQSRVENIIIKGLKLVTISPERMLSDINGGIPFNKYMIIYLGCNGFCTLISEIVLSGLAQKALSNILTNSTLDSHYSF